MLAEGGAVQGREAIIALVVHICPSSQKKLNASGLSLEGGNHQGRAAVDISLVDLGLGSQQQLQDLHVSKLGGIGQGRDALVVGERSSLLRGPRKAKFSPVARLPIDFCTNLRVNLNGRHGGGRVRFSTIR